MKETKIKFLDEEHKLKKARIKAEFKVLAARMDIHQAAARTALDEKIAAGEPVSKAIQYAVQAPWRQNTKAVKELKALAKRIAKRKQRSQK